MENRFEPPPFGAAEPSIFLARLDLEEVRALDRAGDVADRHPLPEERREAPRRVRTRDRRSTCCSSVLSCDRVHGAGRQVAGSLREDARELRLAHDRVVGRVPGRDVRGTQRPRGPRVDGVAAVGVVVVAVAERARARGCVANRRRDRAGVAGDLRGGERRRVVRGCSDAFAIAAPQLSPTCTNAGSNTCTLSAPVEPAGTSMP